LVITELSTLRDHRQGPWLPCQYGWPTRWGSSSPRCCRVRRPTIRTRRRRVRGAVPRVWCRYRRTARTDSSRGGLTLVVASKIEDDSECVTDLL